MNYLLHLTFAHIFNMYPFSFYFQSLDVMIGLFCFMCWVFLLDKKIILPDGASDRLWIDHLFILSYINDIYIIFNAPEGKKKRKSKHVCAYMYIYI